MIYDRSNVEPGCAVVEVDTKEQIPFVLSVDTDRNVLVRSANPVEVAFGGEILTFETKYRAIHAIRGRDFLPSLFHCYGRITNGQS